jgi:predicted DNA-binding transcriptional regulator
VFTHKCSVFTQELLNRYIVGNGNEVGMKFSSRSSSHPLHNLGVQLRRRISKMEIEVKQAGGMVRS